MGRVWMLLLPMVMIMRLLLLLLLGGVAVAISVSAFPRSLSGAVSLLVTLLATNKTLVVVVQALGNPNWPLIR